MNKECWAIAPRKVFASITQRHRCSSRIDAVWRASTVKRQAAAFFIPFEQPAAGIIAKDGKLVLTVNLYLSIA